MFTDSITVHHRQQSHTEIQASTKLRQIYYRVVCCQNKSNQYLRVSQKPEICPIYCRNPAARPTSHPSHATPRRVLNLLTHADISAQNLLPTDLKSSSIPGDKCVFLRRHPNLI